MCVQVIGQAFENVGLSGHAVAADPAPIMQQVIQNQLGKRSDDWLRTHAPQLPDRADLGVTGFGSGFGGRATARILTEVEL